MPGQSGLVSVQTNKINKRLIIILYIILQTVIPTMQIIQIGSGEEEGKWKSVGRRSQTHSLYVLVQLVLYCYYHNLLLLLFYFYFMYLWVDHFRSEHSLGDWW